MQNSHIIPEFLFRALYDDKHRFHSLSTDVGKKNKMLQKGVREPLLCSACEQEFSVIERYASQVLYGGAGVEYSRLGSDLIVSGIDYAILKLFQLSVLWRAGVSQLAVFSQVRLGTHERILRNMLLEGKPGPANQYGCMMFALLHEGEIINDLIVQPSWARLADHKAYRFLFGGMAWVYIVSGHNPPKPVRHYFLKPDGTLRIRFQDIQGMTFLIKTFQDLYRGGKLFDAHPGPLI